MLLMLDNYDSFTYNLVHYFESLGQAVEVHRNDQITVNQVKELAPQYICISPGPGRPESAGISLDLIKELGGTTPILGVCLGHQAIVEAFGGQIVKAQKIMHGKVSEITHNQEDIFTGVPSPFKATRYHSLAANENSIPDSLQITARSEDGEIMAVSHKTLPISGLQFHPESILSEHGMQLMKNFLNKNQETK